QEGSELAVHRGRHEPGGAAEDAIAAELLNAIGVRLEQELGAPRAALERGEQPRDGLRVRPHVRAGALTRSRVIEGALPGREHGAVAELGRWALDDEAGGGAQRGDVRADRLRELGFEGSAVERLDERESRRLERRQLA